MNSKQAYQIHAAICQALTHPLRLEIIDRLRDGEKNVTQLIEELAAPQTTVSRHLRILHSAGMALTHRQGVNTYYRLSSPRVITAYDEMHQYTIEYLARRSELFVNERDA